jgi:hypothetical protein
VPTHEERPGFWRDYDALDRESKRRFRVAVEHFVEDLREKRAPRGGLRVKRVRGLVGVWELTYAPDGRALFAYGDEVRPGERHIVWLRIGGHDVLP